MTSSLETVRPSTLDQCENCKRLKSWAETSYSRGYTIGAETGKILIKHLQDKLAEEREDRLQDNHMFTMEIERLEEVIRAMSSGSIDGTN